jgi:hypothetical protein
MGSSAHSSDSTLLCTIRAVCTSALLSRGRPRQTKPFPFGGGDKIHRTSQRRHARRAAACRLANRKVLEPELLTTAIENEWDPPEAIKEEDPRMPSGEEMPTPVLPVCPLRPRPILQARLLPAPPPPPPAMPSKLPMRPL